MDARARESRYSPSAATEQGHFSHTPRAVSPTVAAVGRLRFRSRDVIASGCRSHLRMSWWVEQTSNGWTPCRGHEHPTAEAALECWDAHFLSAERS